MTRRKTPNRTRTRPIQCYVTDDEYMLVIKLARKRRLSISELIRSWIVSSAAARGIVESDPRKLPFA